MTAPGRPVGSGKAPNRRDLAAWLENLVDRFALASSAPEEMAGIVALRTELFGLLTTAARLVDEDAVTAGTGRTLLSAVRRCCALHQAQWPVIVARDRPGEFRASAQQCTDALRALIRWLRAT